MTLDPQTRYLAQVLDIIHDMLLLPWSKEDWRSLCCGAPMHGEPASNPSYGHYGWCSRCGDASEFENMVLP